MPSWLVTISILLGFVLAVGATVYAHGEDREVQPVPMASTATAPAMGANAGSAGSLPADPQRSPGDTSASAGSGLSTVAPAAGPNASSTSTTTIYTHPIGNPVRVVVPAIEVDAELIPVGLLDDGSMEVPPFGLAGWYELGPKPGAGGPAVIVAHVDTKNGPDVFYRLKELEPGDEVLVYDSDGDRAVFMVDSMEQQLKTELPVGRIWNDTWEPVIRLITCGGDFDRESKHYLSNVIVYGHLVE